jgi:ribulose-bisphosphate carboxylase large chain
VDEKQLIKNSMLVGVAYSMKPMAGHDYRATAAHLDADLFHEKNVNVCTTVGFTKSVDALRHDTDPEMKR